MSISRFLQSGPALARDPIDGADTLSPPAIRAGEGEAAAGAADTGADVYAYDFDAQRPSPAMLKAQGSAAITGPIVGDAVLTMAGTSAGQGAAGKTSFAAGTLTSVTNDAGADALFGVVSSNRANGRKNA